MNMKIIVKIKNFFTYRINGILNLYQSVRCSKIQIGQSPENKLIYIYLFIY
jgi:hypothetical protein